MARKMTPSALALPVRDFRLELSTELIITTTYNTISILAKLTRISSKPEKVNVSSALMELQPLPIADFVYHTAHN